MLPGCMHPLPSPSDFDGLPYPQQGGTPTFFHHNGRKGCKRDYLDALGHFLLGPSRGTCHKRDRPLHVSC